MWIHRPSLLSADVVAAFAQRAAQLADSCARVAVGLGGAVDVMRQYSAVRQDNVERWVALSGWAVQLVSESDFIEKRCDCWVFIVTAQFRTEAGLAHGISSTA